MVVFYSVTCEGVKLFQKVLVTNRRSTISVDTLKQPLQASRQNLVPSLKDESAHGPRLRGLGLRDVLVILQLALSLVLLIGAALFVRSLQRAVSFDPGFAAQNLLIASMETRGAILHKQQGQSNALKVFRVFNPSR